MKELFRFAAGKVQVVAWVRLNGSFTLFGVWWKQGFSVEICNLTIDVQKRDEEF